MLATQNAVVQAIADFAMTTKIQICDLLQIPPQGFEIGIDEHGRDTILLNGKLLGRFQVAIESDNDCQIEGHELLCINIWFEPEETP